VISVSDLRAIAKARLDDAELLAQSNRAEGAQYLCGYSVELALKARICGVLNWSGFPENRKEFENLGSFRTHKLDVLLRLSGQEERIKADHLWAWSVIVEWVPEVRYKPIGKTDLIEVVIMLSAASTLMDVL